MSKLLEEIIKGRKVFFITPDKTLFPQSYLEEYLSLGFECYFVDSDIFLPIEIKIDIILSVFKDSILYFNIDAPIQHTSWIKIIKDMQEKYPEALFGVMYAKRQSQDERHNIEHQFLYTMELKCGCIQLEYQKKNNFSLISQVLFANQATGRRKNVRAVCSNSCTIQLTTEKKQVIQCSLTDISISHFSFVMPVDEVTIAPYEKIENIAFIIRGLRFRSDAVLFMTRPVESGMLYVFAFESKKGQAGLDQSNKEMLIPKIYEIMNENCGQLLNRLFSTAIRKHGDTSEAIEDLKKSIEE